MKLLTQIPESAMVAAFLKAEITSVRFSDELRKVILRLGIAKSVVTNPNLEDEEQNQLRAQLLGDYRGYQQNREIFEDFPDNLTWFKAEISREEIGNLRYNDYSYWNELTDHTHLVKDAVNNIKKGKVVFDVSNNQFLELAEKIRQGKTSFEPTILIGKDKDSPLTVLEGHVRATALGLAGDEVPVTVEVIVGFEISPASPPFPALTGLVILIGPPGAGKSTFAQKFIVDQNLDKQAYISNDVLAKEMFNVDIDRGNKDGEIFAEQDRRITARLSKDQTVIVDATNVKPEARERVIDIAKRYNQPVTAFCFRRNLATLLKQNQMREVKVPEGMVREYAKLMDNVTDDILQQEGVSTIFDV